METSQHLFLILFLRGRAILPFGGSYSKTLEVICRSWHLAKVFYSTHCTVPLSDCVIFMVYLQWGFADWFEGEISSVRISLPLWRSSGGVLLQFFHHIQPSLLSSRFELQQLPNNFGILAILCISANPLEDWCILLIRVRAFLPSFIWADIFIFNHFNA